MIGVKEHITELADVDEGEAPCPLDMVLLQTRFWHLISFDCQ